MLLRFACAQAETPLHACSACADASLDGRGKWLDAAKIIADKGKGQAYSNEKDGKDAKDDDFSGSDEELKKGAPRCRCWC